MECQFLKLERGCKASHTFWHESGGFSEAASGIRNSVGELIEAARHARHDAFANQPGNGLGTNAGVAKIAHADQSPLATETEDDVALFRPGR